MEKMFTKFARTLFLGLLGFPLAEASASAESAPLPARWNLVQQFTVSGSVTDSLGNPLPGVSLSVSGRPGEGATSDEEGRYSVSLDNPDDAVLIVELLGFERQEVAVKGRSSINIVLHAALSQLEEVVVIGYGTARKEDLTGSVGQVDMEDLAKAPVGSFAEALAGRVAGVQVRSSDGQPGGGIDIMIRGAGSLTQSTSPLYVIDGFPVEDLDPGTLNPEDIASMTILKDASSTAIYGSRAANGVVLIQTKRGQVGRPVVEFSSSLGLQLNPKEMELMSPYEFVKYQSELNPTHSTTLAYFAGGKTLEDYRNVEGIDWQDMVIETGEVQTYNLSLRGGNENTRYSFSGSLYDQNGVILNTGYQRYSGRMTVDQAISNKIKAGFTANYSGTTTSGQVVNSGAGSTSPSSFVLFRTWAYRPVTPDEDVDLAMEPVDETAINNSDFRVNPFLDLENQHQDNITNVLDGNAYLSYEITKDLTFKSTVGIRHNRIRQERFFNSKTSQGSPYNPNNINGINGSILHITTSGFSNENILNYQKTLGGDHTIKGLALFSVNSLNSSREGYSSRMLPNESLGMDGLDEGIPYNPVSLESRNTMVSYATRWDYSYRSKYMVTLTFRADGSSKFTDPWGYFPGAAVAWNMDREPFFQEAFPFVSASKLRASYGSTGNNRVGDFDTYARLTQSLDGYSFNNQTPEGAVYVSAVGNPDLRWEKINTIDLGYELGLFNNRISLELDLYRRTTVDLLLSALLPPTTGFSSAIKNIGKLKNEGLEISLNTVNIQTKDFTWSSNFNIGFNRNSIMELTRGQRVLLSNAAYESQFNKPLYAAEIGKPAGMMIGFIWEGNYQYEDFDNPSPGVYILKKDVPTNGAVRNTIQPGDIKYRDLNGDGIINDYDMTIIGRGMPIHTGGFSNNFSYKGIDLNVFFQWGYGNNIYNANRLALEGNSNGRALLNQYASYANRWTPENPTNENYRTRGQGPIGLHSSRVVEDGSFLRLKTVSLGYSIPLRYIQKLYLSQLRIHVSGQNLITWTKYSGMDPEVSTRNPILTPSYDYSAYPQARTIVFGLNASF